MQINPVKEGGIINLVSLLLIVVLINYVMVNKNLIDVVMVGLVGAILLTNLGRSGSYIPETFCTVDPETKDMVCEEPGDYIKCY
jgi:hypothetical protein